MNRKQIAGSSLFILIIMLACNINPLPSPTPTASPTYTPTLTATPTSTPTATPTPIPVIIASGTVDIPQTYTIDIDAGYLPKSWDDPASADVDLWFDAITNNERYLEPTNGAAWAVVGPSAVGYDECKAMPFSTSKVDINSLSTGTYICVSTNIKNITIVRINNIDYSYNGTIWVDFTTWHQP